MTRFIRALFIAAIGCLLVAGCKNGVTTQSHYMDDRGGGGDHGGGGGM